MMAGLSILKRFCQSDGEVALICTFVEEDSSIRDEKNFGARSARGSGRHAKEMSSGIGG